MRQETWKAPAKINLTLRVLGKRDDGFHELESLMAPLELCDELHFRQAGQFALACDTPGVPLDETNLVTRAVRLFERETGTRCGWRVRLVKNIPHGAGLGGGSSDAATTLLALNDLENAALSVDRLTAMAAEVGSDVPFFIHRRACMVRGRGEVVEPVSVGGLPGTPLLLLKPGFGVATPDAYKNCLDARPLPGVGYAPQPMPWGEVANDLEAPVFYKHRFLAEMKVWLQAQPEVDAAMMSGSGSTMIAFLGRHHAEAVAERAKRELDPALWCQPTSIL